MLSESIRMVCLLDCRVCIDTLQQYCDAQPDFTMLFAASSEPCDLRTITHYRPTLLVLDLNYPGEVLQLATQVRQQMNSARIALIAAKWSDVSLSRALSIGVEGLLVKGESMAALFEHLRRVARSEFCVSAELRSRLRYDASQGRYRLAEEGPLTTLTGKQLEIFRLLACGDSLKMIASKLNLSRKSIDGHKYRLMRKLGVKDRVLLSRLAIREGIIQP